MTRGAYGRLPKTPDVRDYRFAAPKPYMGAFVDLSDGFPEEPYDQGQLGSCVSQGTAAILDFARAKQGLPPLKRPSRLFVYFQGRVRGKYPIDEDTGLQVRDGLTVVSKDGAPPETDWPYDVDQFTRKPPARAYQDALGDIAVAFGAVRQGDIDATIASGYPCVFGFTVHESFESDELASTGVMAVSQAGEQELGGHCIVVVSTAKDGSQINGGIPGVKYRKCRNSWGTSWGLGGYFWMPVDVMDGQESDDFWMLTHVDDPSGPTPPAPPPLPSSLDVAVQALRSDRETADWVNARHLGHAKHVATLVRAVLEATP